MKHIALLGSTGSIGKSALEIVRQNKDKLKISSLTANRNWRLLAEQAIEFEPEFVACADTSCHNELTEVLKHTKIKIGWGDEGLEEAVTNKNLDTTIAAIVGFAGLKPVLAAIKNKHTICLANKETLVVAGELVMNAIKQNNTSLLPVDSEHSAIFQCLQSASKTPPNKLIITASGGPFRTFSNSDLQKVTVEQALKHPNWNMGGKITIDSATLMNKGLEIIEAHWLFDMPFEKIDVVVHPQSIIHSLVEFSDGSVIAQLGLPDMKLPIQYALSYPNRWNAPLQPLDLSKIATMTFEQPRYKDFYCLSLAIEAGKVGGTLPCILNASNEVAVAAFLDKKIGFVDIPKLIEKTLDKFKREEVVSVDQLIELDYQAREQTTNLVKTL